MALVPDDERMARDSGIWIPNHTEPKLTDFACCEACDAKPIAPTQESIDAAYTLRGDDNRHVELVEVATGRPTARWHLIIVGHLVRGDTAPEFRVVRNPLVV